jgi:hypothetical protein
MLEDNASETSNEPSTSEEASTSTTSNLSQLDALRQELEANRALIKNLRKYEKSYKEENEKALAEQGKWKELYEATQSEVSELKNSLTNIKLESVLDKLVGESGAKNSNTVKRLIDRTAISFSEDGSVDAKSIQKQLIDLQKADANLFGRGEEETPKPKKAQQDAATSSYEIEITKAKTQAEVNAIYAKYFGGV